MGRKEELIKEAKRLELIAEAQELESQLQPRDTLSAAPPLTALDKGEGIVRSALEGASVGLSEPVISGVKAAEQHIENAIKQATSPQDFYDKVTNMDRLREAYRADVGGRRRFEAENPGTATAAELTGAIAPALLTMGGSAGASTASKAAKIAAAPGEAINWVGQGAKALIRKSARAEKLLQSPGVAGSAARVAEAGVSGATQAVTAEGAKRLAQQPTGFIREEDDIAGIGEIATSGAAFGGGLKAIPELAAQSGRLAKKAARVFTGVGSDAIDTYLARPEAIKNAKTVAEIKDEVDEVVAKMREDVDSAKLNREQAHDALKVAEENVAELIRENKFIVNQNKADIRQQFRNAKSNLDLAFKEAASESKAARLPLQADDILDSVEKVKAQVTDLSQESYKILGLHKGKFKLTGVTREMSTLQNDLKVDGELLSSDAEAAHNILNNWKEKLRSIETRNKNGVPAEQVKRIIQELDSDLRTASDRLAGSFSDKTHNSLMGVRRLLDSKIKTQVAGYAEVMEETAKMNQLRADFSKMFGKREAVASKLQRLDSPNGEFERAKLQELGEITGKDFKTPLDEYVALKGRTRTSIAQEDLRRGLPEYSEYVDATAQNARASRPEFGQGLIDRARNASPEAVAARQATQAFQGAEEALVTAKGTLEPFKRMSPVNSESIIRQLMGNPAKKIELRRLVTSLGQASDQDFAQMINDLRVREGFEKGFQNGSSNVNMWAIMGGVLGFVAGDPTLGTGSAAAGAAFGKVMDSYGPQITRRVLDGIVMMRGIPTVQKINSTFADIPPALKEQLKADLMRMVAISASHGSVVITPEQRAELAQDFQDSEHLNAVEKARAITDMNTKGTVEGPALERMMIGTEKIDPSKLNVEEPQPKLPPRYDQVTDFVKNKKPERY